MPVDSTSNYSDLGWFAIAELDKIVRGGPIQDEMGRQWLNLETFELNPPSIDTFLSQADKHVFATVNSREHSVNIILPEIRRSLENPKLSSNWAPTYPVVIRAFPNDEWLKNRAIRVIEEDVRQNPILVAQVLVAIAAIEPLALNECYRRLLRLESEAIIKLAVQLIDNQRNSRKANLLNFELLDSPAAQALRHFSENQTVYPVASR